MAFSVSSSYAKLRAVVDKTSNDALPPPSTILDASKKLKTSLPSEGLGDDATQQHLLSDICPAFNGPKTSANYYGFVTGGVFPIAEVADNIVTAFDQSVQVHLPDQSISTFVEDRALHMLAELVKLGPEWKGKTFTTGATGSNILGLACGRETILNSRLSHSGEVGNGGVGELGLLAACLKAGVKEVQVLTSMGHSSLFKAASVVGIGRSSVKNIPRSKEEPWKMDLEALETELKRGGVASIVAISAGEVNTGRFATGGLAAVKQIREICDAYGAWLHVDGAFGLFARSLPETPEFQNHIESAAGLELADSITGDCHKLLNVPYDCGVFFTRSATTLSDVFGNPNAAYLSGGDSSIPSPLNIGLENSRRFRALPVYAVLCSYGKNGLSEMFARQVQLARAVAKYLESSPGYELLPRTSAGQDIIQETYMVALFRAKDETINKNLVKSINATRKIYISGTQWEGKPASRIAVSTWKVDIERDTALVTSILESMLEKSS
ncbi:pyridoxal phosphate-dependent transferase [Halenospora varia]|nr:pyridoxal phosphate-dependent transferase [Halenospora varia]